MRKVNRRGPIPRFPPEPRGINPPVVDPRHVGSANDREQARAGGLRGGFLARAIEGIL